MPICVMRVATTVASSATGAWAGQDDNLARYVAEGDFWQFFEAGTQVRIVFNDDDGGLYVLHSGHGPCWRRYRAIPKPRRGNELPALAIIGGIKAAFIKHAREDLGLSALEQEPEE